MWTKPAGAMAPVSTACRSSGLLGACGGGGGGVGWGGAGWGGVGVAPERRHAHTQNSCFIFSSKWTMYVARWACSQHDDCAAHPIPPNISPHRTLRLICSVRSRSLYGFAVLPPCSSSSAASTAAATSSVSHCSCCCCCCCCCCPPWLPARAAAAAKASSSAASCNAAANMSRALRLNTSLAAGGAAVAADGAAPAAAAALAVVLAVRRRGPTEGFRPMPGCCSGGEGRCGGGGSDSCTTCAL